MVSLWVRRRAGYCSNLTSNQSNWILELLLRSSVSPHFFTVCLTTFLSWFFQVSVVRVFSILRSAARENNVYCQDAWDSIWLMSYLHHDLAWSLGRTIALGPPSEHGSFISCLQSLFWLWGSTGKAGPAWSEGMNASGSLFWLWGWRVGLGASEEKGPPVPAKSAFSVVGIAAFRAYRHKKSQRQDNKQASRWVASERRKEAGQAELL